MASSTTGIVGTVSAANSLVGGAPGDLVGDFSPQNLFSGRYALRSDMNGLGAVTVFDPASPPVGVVSAANSLIGVSSGDEVGSGGLQFLGSSTWAVLSSGWDGAGVDRGAVSFLDASTGNFAGGGGIAFRGTIDASNSLIGGSDGDEIGSNGLEFVAGSLYAVLSPNHDNVSSGNVDTGALTWYTPGSALAGLVDGSNSLLGIQDDDLIGSFSHYFQSLSGGGAPVHRRGLRPRYRRGGFHRPLSSGRRGSGHLDGAGRATRETASAAAVSTTQ